MIVFAQEQLPELPAYGFTPTLGSLLSLVITVLLPVLVGLLTKQSWSSGLKAVLLLVLAAVNAILTSALEAANTGVDWEFIPVVYTIAINFLIAVAMHFGLWKPTGTSAAVQRVAVADRSGTRRLSQP